MDESVLLNYLKGIGNQADFQLVEEWCEQSPENRKCLEELYYIHFIDERIKVMEGVDTESSLQKVKAQIERNRASLKPISQSTKRNWKRFLIPIAAFLTGIIFTGITIWGISSQQKQVYTLFTEAGQRSRVVLPDGSKVWLNTSTKLDYQSSFWGHKRLVNLSGEAYFEVAHDDNAPFIVNTKAIQTKVLGTKFNIRARRDESIIVATLLNGKIQINSPKTTEEGVILKPGQTLSMDVEHYKSKLVEYPCPDDVLLWMKGRLTFEQKSLFDITTTLERLFDVHFIYLDETLKQESFTCDFSTDTKPETILSVLSQTNRLNYKREGRIIRLYK